MSLEEVLKKYDKFINPEFPLNYFPFSLISMNLLVGDVRGIKGGRIVQLLGNESSGKTTMAIDLCKGAQSQGMKAAVIDIEHAFDLDYARYLGVNTDELLLVKPDTAETGFDIVEALIKSGVGIVVIDSIAVITAAADLEKGNTEAERMASTAGSVTRFIRRVIPLLDTHGALLVIINQNRANISTLAKKETKPYGPKIIQYASSLTIHLKRTKNGEDEAIVEASTEKNKLGGKERSKAEIVMVYQEGFDIKGDIIRLALEENIVEKKGAWFYYGDIKAQGMQQAKEAFPLEEIADKVLKEYE